MASAACTRRLTRPPQSRASLGRPRSRSWCRRTAPGCRSGWRDLHERDPSMASCLRAALLRRLLDLARADNSGAGGQRDPRRRAGAGGGGRASHRRLRGRGRAAAAPEGRRAGGTDRGGGRDLVENSRPGGRGCASMGAAPSGGSGSSCRTTGPARLPAITSASSILSTPSGARRASGLGLSIARSLLAACGGSIVSRPAEEGAEFEICLPAAKARSGAIVRAPSGRWSSAEVSVPSGRHPWQGAQPAWYVLLRVVPAVRRV